MIIVPIFLVLYLNTLAIFDLCDRAMHLIVHSEAHLLLAEVKYYRLITTAVVVDEREKKVYYSLPVKTNYFENKKIDDITQPYYLK